jgi:hypothetical protein
MTDTLRIHRGRPLTETIEPSPVNYGVKGSLQVAKLTSSTGGVRRSHPTLPDFKPRIFFSFWTVHSLLQADCLEKFHHRAARRASARSCTSSLETLAG